jgi:hypothetical protein
MILQKANSGIMSGSSSRYHCSKKGSSHPTVSVTKLLKAIKLATYSFGNNSSEKITSYLPPLLLPNGGIASFVAISRFHRVNLTPTCFPHN